jgi:hypothetical protein
LTTIRVSCAWVNEAMPVNAEIGSAEICSPPRTAKRASEVYWLEMPKAM